MARNVETIIVGGGQAGLAISYHLSRQGHPHLILERSRRVADVWRNHRWDSFTLVTPNWALQMPGAEYRGSDPDGFMSRDALVRYFDEYVERFKLPVRYGVKVTAVEQAPGGYRTHTSDGPYSAANVVVATGLFQSPRIPAFSEHLPHAILQLHSTQYRNPRQLRAGAVLVVGSGQSGCQIADELQRSGRKVYLSVGSTGRAPRRYRGKDTLWWLHESGFFDTTIDQMPSPKARFASNPHLSGVEGGRSLNLHQFARDGIVLLGHVRGISDGTLTLAPDLKESLAAADKFEAELLKGIDDYIAARGLKAPEEAVAPPRDGYDAEEIPELDLSAAGITNVIWACGYTFDFRWIKLPVLDDYGYPVQERGVTAYPGLYFLGLPLLHSIKSGLLLGVGADAAHVASHITAKAAVS